MSKTEEAVAILESLGLPRGQRNERSALTLLALAGLKPSDEWRNATRPLMRIWDIMAFMRDHHGKDYAANSRETIRRQTVHQFEQARIVDRNPDDPARPTNSGKNAYALTADVLAVLKSFGTPRFHQEIKRFSEKRGRLCDEYAKRRAVHAVHVRLPEGQEALLSPGKHNELQVAVVEQFGPRFAPGSRLLYLGDSSRKHVVCDQAAFKALNVSITEHDKLPDVVLHHARKKWLFLIEAVTSHGPVSPKRHAEINAMLSRCPAYPIYVTAFLCRADFRKYAADVAWETEVWIAESPDHMVHFNGSKFLGPYRQH